MAFDGLDIEIGGSSGGAQAAISATRKALGGLGRAADGADDALEELGDTLSATARKTSALTATAGAATLSLTGLSTSGTGAAASLTSLGVTVAAVTTALVGLSAVAAPLVATVGGLAAAVGGLAAAFGTVLGTGLFVFNEQGETLAEALKDVREEVEVLIFRLGGQFTPLIEDAIAALPTLIESVVDALGPLDEFAAALRAFGGELLEFIPAAVSALFDLAREALPVLTRGFRFLRREGGSIFRDILRTTREVGPLLLDLGRSLAALTPQLIRVGTRLLRVIIPAFNDFLGLVGDVLSVAERSSGLVDFFERTIARTRAWFESTGRQQLAALGSSVLGAITAALDPDGEGDGGLLSALIDRLGSLLDGVATWLTDGGGSAQIEMLVEDLFGQLATALGSLSEEDIQGATDNVLTIIGSIFDGIIAALNSDEAGTLGAQLGRVAGLTLRTFADALVDYARSDAFEEDLSGLASGLSNTVGRALVEGAVGATGLEGDRAEAFRQTFDVLNPAASGSTQGAFSEAQVTTPGETRVTDTREITIEVVGDTDVIEDVVTREERRRIDRLTSTTGTAGRR